MKYPILSIFTLLFVFSVVIAVGCNGDDKKKESSLAQCTDGIDNDGDGLIDCADPDCKKACDGIDTDGDGVPDYLDVCEGHDDNVDTDGDGVPDGCDICPGHDDNVDTDGDGVPDGCDACPGHDDSEDADGDGVPDGCDACPGQDDRVDSDGDGVPDGCDICPGGNDMIDTDGDGIPDDCDPCPFTEECNTCMQACHYMEFTCGFTNSCRASGMNCDNNGSECEGNCFLAATCMEIMSMVTQNPNPVLSACLIDCDPGNSCTICTGSRCTSQLNACYQDATCTAFLECSQSCADTACIDACATAHSSLATINLRSCTCSSCVTECSDLCG